MEIRDVKVGAVLVSLSRSSLDFCNLVCCQLEDMSSLYDHFGFCSCFNDVSVQKLRDYAEGGAGAV